MKTINDNRPIEEKLKDVTVVVASHKISEAVILFVKCWLKSSSANKYNLVVGYDKDWVHEDINALKSLYDKVYDVSDVYDAQRKFLRAIDSGAYTDLIKNFVVFLILGILLFGYNMLIWMTIAVKTSVGFQNGVKKNVFKALIKMSVSEMSAESVGDRITRLNNDTDTACGYLNAPVNYMHMVIALFNVIATIVFMGFINPVMLLFTV